MATFMLIHGACHGAWCWEKLVPLLEARGHKVVAPDLPGSGEDRTTPVAEITLAAYVNAVSKLLDKEDDPVVLVGHSLGGMTITHVAEARRRKIAALVYLTAIMPECGQTARDITGSEGDSLVRRSYESGPDSQTYTFKRASIPTLFYNDCEAMDVYRAMERLRPQAVAIPTTPASFTRERWGGVKRWYVYCTRSNAITLSMQHAMVAKAPCETLSLDAGHSPFYSMPEELADALEKIAAAST